MESDSSRNMNFNIIKSDIRIRIFICFYCNGNQFYRFCFQKHKKRLSADRIEILRVNIIQFAVKTLRKNIINSKTYKQEGKSHHYYYLRNEKYIRRGFTQRNQSCLIM